MCKTGCFDSATTTTTTTSITTTTAPLSGCDSSSISDSQYCFTIPVSYYYYDYYDYNENYYHGIDEITVGATITMSKKCAPDYHMPGLYFLDKDYDCDYFHRQNFCDVMDVNWAVLIISHTSNGYITPFNCPQCGCTEDDIITLNERQSGTRSNSGSFAAFRAMLKESRNI